jgi:hypothetical protein
VNIGHWFRTVWPRRGKAVAGEYLSVGTHRLFLADVALRGFVFTPFPAVATEFEAGKLEGRRSLALEIIRISGEAPERLFAEIEKSPTPERISK